MPEIVEGDLKFYFESDSEAIKFDETNWHRHQMRSTLKAMDILCSTGNHYWWLEIKDCLGHERDNLPRLSAAEPDELPRVREYIKKNRYEHLVTASRKKPFIVDEVYEKFRDTLVSLAVASRSADTELSAFYSLFDTAKVVNVVLVLTWEGRDFKRLALRLQDKLNRCLAPYGVAGFVTDGTTQLPGQVWQLQ